MGGGISGALIRFKTIVNDFSRCSEIRIVWIRRPKYMSSMWKITTPSCVMKTCIKRIREFLSHNPFKRVPVLYSVWFVARFRFRVVLNYHLRVCKRVFDCTRSATKREWQIEEGKKRKTKEKWVCISRNNNNNNNIHIRVCVFSCDCCGARWMGIVIRTLNL